MRDAHSTSPTMSLRFPFDRYVKSSTTHRVTHRIMCVGIVYGFLSTTFGCGHDATAPAPTQSKSYWAVRANYHAVNIATVPGYNTVRIKAVPLSATDDTLPEAGTVTYSSKDSGITVDSTGLVTARFATTLASVIVSLQYQRVTLADTVFVRVTETVPQFPLATLSIQPQPDGLDSARAPARVNGSAGFNRVISVYATNTSGSPATDTVCNVSGCPLLVDFSSSDETIATVGRQTGRPDLTRPGAVTFYATTYAYGVTKQDSLPFVVTWPSLAFVDATWPTPFDSKTPVLAFSPAQIIISVGGSVVWKHGFFADPHPVGDSMDVVFDDSTAPQPSCGVVGNFIDCTLAPPNGAGNIAPFFPDFDAAMAGDIFGYIRSYEAARSFPVAGTYSYHSRRYPNATGRIIVSSGF
jgi:hypothetical protein